MDTYDIIRQQMNFFFREKMSVHIKLKNGHWKNGSIEEMSAEFCILNERVTGREMVFFIAVERVDPFKEVEK